MSPRTENPVTKPTANEDIGPTMPSPVGAVSPPPANAAHKPDGQWGQAAPPHTLLRSRPSALFPVCFRGAVATYFEQVNCLGIENDVLPVAAVLLEVIQVFRFHGA